MSQRAYERLVAQRKLLDSEYAETVKARGECGEGGDWHDNAALDYYAAQENLIASRISQVDASIRSASIINPPLFARRVTIGAEVEVEFGKDDRESFLILGPADNDPSSGIISHETPLAKAIMNRAPGETVSFTVEDNGRGHETRLKVISVKPGKF